MRPHSRKVLSTAIGVMILAAAFSVGFWTLGFAPSELSWAELRSRYQRSSLRAAVDSDDVCETARILDVRGVDVSQALRLVFGGPLQEAGPPDDDFRRLIAALLERSGQEAARELAALPGEPAAFYRALVLAGWIEGLRPERLDLTEALAILRTLRSKDPGNGAVALYEAALLNRMGARPPEVLRVIGQAIALERLDNYHARISKTLLVSSASSSSRFLLGAELQARLPAPRLQAAWKDLLPLIADHGSARMMEAAVKFSRNTLKQNGLRRSPEGTWAAALAEARNSPAARCERQGIDRLVVAETRLFRRQLANAAP